MILSDTLSSCMTGLELLQDYKSVFELTVSSHDSLLTYSDRLLEQ